MITTEKSSSIRSITEFCQSISANGKVVSWDTTIDRYARTAEKFKSILAQPELSKYPQSESFIPRLNTLIDRCVNSDFQIAFVGTIKAGKSTLINAILGQNVASTRVTPETAVLTKFRHSNDNYIKVIFYSSEEWDSLWKTISNRADVFKDEYAALNGDFSKGKWIGHEDIHKYLSDADIRAELEKWSSSKHVEHYFVKEIEVGLKSLDLPENVVFVDTPGLDDPVKYRSDVTRKYIERANAVFVCVTAHAMTGEEQKTIFGVFANSSSSEKIFIIGTQTDNLNNPKKDWEEQHREWVKYLSDKTGFGSREAAESQIMPTAAFVENLCREFKKDKSSVSDEQKNMLAALAIKYGTITPMGMMNGASIDDAIIKLLDYTFVDKLMERIRASVLIKYKEWLISDINKSYTNLKSELADYFREIKTSNDELLSATKGNMEEIEQKFTNAQIEAEAGKQAKDILINLMNDAKEDNQKRIEELKKALMNLTA